LTKTVLDDDTTITSVAEATRVNNTCPYVVLVPNGAQDPLQTKALTQFFPPVLVPEATATRAFTPVAPLETVKDHRPSPFPCFL